MSAASLMPSPAPPNEFGDPHLYKLGAELRAEVQGPQRLSQALRDEDDLDEFYHLFGHECCYAQVWSRSGLSRLERALTTFSMIAALGPSSDTLRVHVRGATRSGCSRAQLRQVLAMVTWYAGVPVGQQATATVRAPLKDLPEAEARAPDTAPAATMQTWSSAVETCACAFSGNLEPMRKRRKPTARTNGCSTATTSACSRVTPTLV